MDSITVAPSVSGGLGDEALADAIRAELRQDASTTALAIDVEVTNGVAYLHGSVADLADVENAEDVAGRVPGLREVIEDLELESS